jgi:DNA polymerase-4
MDRATTSDETDDLPWEGPAIGLLDLDAFFASVEQLDHPEWRGHPVIVGGDADRRGVVSTASYEARTYGVHSAMPAATARRLCPEAVWTHGHFDRYRCVSGQVMSLIGRESPYVEQVSIDEAFFDVTPGRFSHESPLAICERIQSRVAALGVTCSIGLGSNKTIAKIASERDKPRGLTVVLPGSEQSFLAPLPVRAMSGIGASAERRLVALGITTLGQLAAADRGLLASVLGSQAGSFALRAAGLEQSVVSEQASRHDPKSVSNERTYATDLTTEADVRAAAGAMASMVATRLRRKGLRGTCVTVKVRYDLDHASTAQSRLDHPTDDEGDFGPMAQDLAASLWAKGMRVRLVGVGISGFADSAESEQLNLFDDQTSAKQRQDLHRTCDEVRERFGNQAVALGRDLRLSSLTTNTSPAHKQDD